MAYAPNIARIEDDGSETPMTLSAKSRKRKQRRGARHNARIFRIFSRINGRVS